MTREQADVVVVGAGMSGLVAACDLIEAGKKVILLDQEPEESLGGQVYWAFGGLFMVDSPEQRRFRIRDSRDLAWQDWLRTAGFDREEDHWPRKWAEAYVNFAAGEKRSWMRELGLKFFPFVGWSERTVAAEGPGNSVPRFHITWGAGPAVLEPFARRVREAQGKGLLRCKFRHRVSRLELSGGVVTGVSGEVLEPSNVARGCASSRVASGEFSFASQAVILSSGGIGGNFDLIRQCWPERLGAPPERMLRGVPHSADGRILGIAEDTGCRLINRDRMWHYPEGVKSHEPIWADEGIRALPGPSSLWLDARGQRMPAPLALNIDTLASLAHLRSTGYDYSWLVSNQRIVNKEFGLAGSAQNPDLTGKRIWKIVTRGLSGRVTPVKILQQRGEDFLTASTLEDLSERMAELANDGALDRTRLGSEVAARDAEAKRLGKRPALLDAKAGPLVAVRMWVLSRKTLGGLETDLQGRVLGKDGRPVSGLYAAGEAAGFGGGGMHGYRALEGTFLGGCLLSGRVAGREAGKAVL